MRDWYSAHCYTNTVVSETRCEWLDIGCDVSSSTSLGSPSFINQSINHQSFNLPTTCLYAVRYFSVRSGSGSSPRNVLRTLAQSWTLKSWKSGWSASALRRSQSRRCRSTWPALRKRPSCLRSTTTRWTTSGCTSRRRRSTRRWDCLWIINYVRVWNFAFSVISQPFIAIWAIAAYRHTCITLSTAFAHSSFIAPCIWQKYCAPKAPPLSLLSVGAKREKRKWRPLASWI